MDVEDGAETVVVETDKELKVNTVDDSGWLWSCRERCKVQQPDKNHLSVVLQSLAFPDFSGNGRKRLLALLACSQRLPQLWHQMRW